MAGLEDALWLDAKVVLLDLIVPRSNDFAWIGLGITVGRPQTVDVLAEAGVGPMREAVLGRQCVGPFLRKRAQLLVQPVWIVQSEWISGIAAKLIRFHKCPNGLYLL